MPETFRERDRQFKALYRFYRDLYGVQGETQADTYRLTAHGAWATSRAPHLYRFFKTLGLERFRRFIDLGSGDGIVACTAGLFTRALGIEGDEELCRRAHHAARTLNLTDRVSFLCANYLTQNIREADCLYLYPDKPFDGVEQILEGWTGTLLVYGPHLPPRRLVPVQRMACGKERLVVYRNAAPRERM